MKEKIDIAITYAKGNSKLEGLDLTEEEQEIISKEIVENKDNKEFVEIVKKLVKKSDNK